MRRLSRTDARRMAVRAQLLDLPRPDSVLDVVHQLTLLQADPTAAIAPSADVVLWSRLGSSYSRDELQTALETRELVDLHGLLRPGDDLALYTDDMAHWSEPKGRKDWELGVRAWVEANDRCRRDILARLEADGPTAARDIPDTCDKPWKSSGWNDDRSVRLLVEAMQSRGEVAVAGMRGRDRLWDLAERVYPDEEPVPRKKARLIRQQRRLASLGLARAKATETPVEPNDVGVVGEEVEVDGTTGTWRADPDQLDRLGERFRGRAALLSPIDRLVFDRVRMDDLFGFDYQLEMYKPAAKRRFGYWAMPILYGDKLVGKLDAKADHKAGVLWINAIHRDTDFSAAMTRAVDDEINDLARWLELDVRSA